MNTEPGLLAVLSFYIYTAILKLLPFNVSDVRDIVLKNVVKYRARKTSFYVIMGNQYKQEATMWACPLKENRSDHNSIQNSSQYKKSISEVYESSSFGLQQWTQLSAGPARPQCSIQG